AEALLDFRFVDGPDGEKVLADLQRSARDAADEVAGTTITLKGGVARVPLSKTDASTRLLKEYAACARSESLGSDESPLLGGGSAANTCSAVGVPAIDGLGPRGRGFHTTDEYIERATLLPKTRALVRFLAGRIPTTT